MHSSGFQRRVALRRTFAINFALRRRAKLPAVGISRVQTVIANARMSQWDHVGGILRRSMRARLRRQASPRRQTRFLSMSVNANGFEFRRVLAMVVCAFAFAAEATSDDGATQMCLQAIGWRTRIAFHAVANSEPPSGERTPRWTREIIQSEVVRDRNWGDVTRTAEYVRSGTRPGDAPQPLARSRSVWCSAGQLLFVGDTSREFDNATLYRTPGLALDDCLADPAAGAILDGVVYGWNGRGLEQVVESTPAGILRVSKPDAATSVIEGTTKDGSIYIELGGEQARELRSFRVEWGPQDLFRGKLLKDWGLAWVSLRVVNSKFVEAGAGRPATAGRVEYSFTETGGTTESRQYDIERSRIDLAPDTSGLSACDIGLPSGFLIKSPEHPQVALEWRDGRVTTRVNRDAFSRVAELILASSDAELHGAADTVPQVARPDDHDHVEIAAPYCGVLCVYGMALRLGADGVDPAVLVSERFIGGLKGSTTAELLAAAAEIGVHGAVARAAATVEQVFDGSPRILMVRSTPDATRADHFVLTTRRLGPFIEVMNPARDGARVSLWTEDFLARNWDGVVIEVRGRSHSANVIESLVQFASRSKLVVLAATALLGVGVLHRMGTSARQQMPLATASSGCLSILCVSALTALLYNFAPLGSGTPVALSIVDQSSSASGLASLADVDVNAARLVASHPAARFVDARYRGDFNIDHIPGAASIPFGSSDGVLDQALCNVGRDQLLIVYCQTSNCKFADLLAGRLRLRGFRNMAVLRSGMEGWRGVVTPP